LASPGTPTINQDHLVRKALEENGVTIIDFNFDFSGLKTWQVNEDGE
jgi:hypothetical protein